MTTPATPIAVSVIVPTRNRPRFLLNLLEDLVAQDHRPLEILVVDQSDQASQDVEKFAARFPALIVLCKVPFRNVSMARNYGWQRAKHDALVYLDDDTRCESDLVSKLLAALQLPGIGMVAGGIDENSHPAATPRRVGRYSPWTATAHPGFGASHSQYVDHVFGTSFAVWRHFIERFGGFDEALGIAPALYEETELPVRARAAGFRIWFAANARVKHLAAPSGGNRATDIAQYVYCLSRNRSIMIRRHSRWFQTPTAIINTVRLILAYAWAYRSCGLIESGVGGAFRGWIAGSESPKCTIFPTEGENRNELHGMTVIVPTLERGEILADTLRDLVAQQHRPLEILVVDQSETATPAVESLVAQYPDLVRYHRVGFRGLPQARNYGWQHARHNYLLYVDDDVRCSSDLVSEHLRVLTRPGVGLVGGGIDDAQRPHDIVDRPGSWNRWSATATRGFAATGEFAVEHGPGGNFSIRRDAIIQCGGIDEALSRGAALHEETELALRVAACGYEVRFNGMARLQHLAAPTGGCRVQRPEDHWSAYGTNRGILARRHSRAYQYPILIPRLLWTSQYIFRHYGRSWCSVRAYAKGCLRGWSLGSKAPKCSVFFDTKEAST